MDQACLKQLEIIFFLQCSVLIEEGKGSGQSDIVFEMMTHCFFNVAYMSVRCFFLGVALCFVSAIH